MAINEYEDILSNMSKETPPPEPGSAPATQQADYDTILDQEKAAQKSKMQQSMYAAAATDPDRRAKVLELAQKTNLPPNIVERNFDDVQKKSALSVDYDGLIDNTPGLARWLENPDNSSIGRNDIDKLQRVEHATRSIAPNESSAGLLDFTDALGRAGETGWNQLQESGYWLAGSYGKMDLRTAAEGIAESRKRAIELRSQMPDYAQEFNKIMAEKSNDVNESVKQFTGSFDEFRDGKILDALKNFGSGGIKTVGDVLDMVKAAGERPPGLIYSAVENLANSLPSLLTGFAGASAGALGGPAAPITVPAGFVAGSFAGGVPTEVGGWISESMAKRGVDTTDPEQIMAAFSDPKLMAEIRGQAERKGLTTAGIDAIFNLVAGRLVKVGPGANIAQKAASGLADVGIQAFGEAVSEGGGQFAATGQVDVGESLQEGITSLGHSMGDVAIGASKRAVYHALPVKAVEQITVDTEKAVQAQQDAVALTEIGEAVKEVKFAQSMPGKLKELIDTASAGEETAAVYFDVQAWDEYWTKQGKSPADMADKIMGDGGHRYFEAKESGALMEVQMGDYISNVAPTADFEGMLPITRTKIDGMTLAEAQEHLKALPATMEELSKEVRGEPIPESSAKSIGTEISERLRAEGFDDKSARTYAKLYEKAFNALGTRAGVDPMELFKSYNLSINRVDESQAQSGEKVLNQLKLVHSKMQENIANAPGKSNKKVDAPKTELPANQLDLTGLISDLKKEPRNVTNGELSKISTRIDQINEVLDLLGDNDDDINDALSVELDDIMSVLESSEKIARRRESGFTSIDGGKKFSQSEALSQKISKGAKYDPETGTYTNGKKIEANVSVRSDDLLEQLQPGLSEAVGGEALEINTLEVAKKQQSKGLGAQALKDIEAIARQENQQHIVLKAEPLSSQMAGEGKAENLDRLIKFYEKNGYKVFKKNKTNAIMIKDLGQIYSQNSDDSTRGQIRFGKNGINIDLLKNSDLSTFLHETGHFYLEVLGDLAANENAPKQIQDDYAAILKWLDVRDRASIGVDQHEQFARGFEAYLMEGKAPSRDLQTAFTRFKVWLTEIYRQLKNLAVDLTPEVRDVFNRMLATEDEINDATIEQNFEPIFPDPAAFGMTGQKAEDYITAREEARSYAENVVFNKLMEAHRREKESWYREKKSEIKASVTEQVNGSTLYKAIDIMRSGILPDGSTQEIKLNREAIVTAYGEEFVKELPVGVVASKAKGGGIHPDAAAQLLGFEDGDSMLTQLANAPKKDVLINQQVEARMSQLYPDLLTEDPRLLDEEAMQAIHNDKRAYMLRLELEHMVTMASPSVKEVGRRVARRVPTEKQVRAEADKAIGRRKVEDLKPYLFQRAERKYAKEAGELLAKGDFDGAFEAKRKELYNHELYRSAVEANERIEKDLKKFKRIAQTDEKLSKTRDVDLVNAARAVLARFGIGRTDKTSDEYLAQMRQYDPDTYNNMMALVASATENVGPYKQVPFEDFVAMSDSVTAIWDLAKSKQEIVSSGERVNVEDVKLELATQLDNIVKDGKRLGYDKAVSDQDKFRIGVLGARASLTRVEHWTEAVDVGNSGPFKKYIWTPISEATTTYRLKKEAVLKEYKAILETIKGTTAPKPIVANEISYTFKDRTELLMALLHTGNESNMSKLLRGRNWGTVDMAGNLDMSKWNAFIDRAHNEGIITKADYDFVQKVWDLMESIKPDAQRAHKEMYGYYFAEITAHEIETPFGTYRGGYIPAKVDIYASEDASLRVEREEFERNNNSFQFPTTGRGFTKSRVDQYAAPLDLNMSMLGGHIDGVMRFTYIEPAVKRTARLTQDKEFRAELAKLDPTVGRELLTPWLQRAAQQKVVFPSDTGIGKLTDGVARFLRSSVAMQIMVLNVTNTLQQATGLVVAMTKIKPRHVRDAFVTYISDVKGTTDIALEKSEWMRSTQGSSLYETAQAIDQIIVDPTTWDSVRDFAKRHTYFMQAAAQNIVNTITWTGAYEQAIEAGANEEQAVREADSAVRTTQGTQNPEDISRFETGTATSRLFTQFAGYFNMLANLNATELIKISREVGLKKGAGKAFYVYTTGFMLPAVLSQMIVQVMSGKGFDEDDDDKYLDDALGIFFGSQFKTATAALPYVGAAINATYNKFNDNLYDDRMSLSPVVTTIESLAGVPAEVYKSIHGDVANKKKVVKDVLMLTGVLSNLPVGPIGKPVGYVMDVKSGRARPKGAADFARGLITGQPGPK